MSGPCREMDLEALLTGELSASAAERVDAHVAACGSCARTLAPGRGAGRSRPLGGGSRTLGQRAGCSGGRARA